MNRIKRSESVYYTSCGHSCYKTRNRNRANILFSAWFSGNEFTLTDHIHLIFIEIVKIASADEFFETDSYDYDGFITSVEVGMTLVMLYPEYAVAVDKTKIFRFPIGYAVAIDNLQLQVMLNSWLDVQRSSGRIDRLFDYWIQGKGADIKNPR